MTRGIARVSKLVVTIGCHHTIQTLSPQQVVDNPSFGSHHSKTPSTVASALLFSRTWCSISNGLFAVVLKIIAFRQVDILYPKVIAINLNFKVIFLP